MSKTETSFHEGTLHPQHTQDASAKLNSFAVEAVEPLNQNLTEQNPISIHENQNHLTDQIEALLATHQYELVALELELHREKTLRLYVDLLNVPEDSDRQFSMDDCVAVNEILNPILDQMDHGITKTVELLFQGAAYDLEVSSPGIDRPLRKPSDYTRFSGEFARLHTTRSLTQAEMSNDGYFEKNSKQKNFFGIVKGFQEGKILFAIVPEDGTRAKLKKGEKKKLNAKKSGPSKEWLITLPIELVQKANLEREVKI